MSALCGGLHDLANSLPELTYPFSFGEIPANGLYFVFERGETGHGGRRIVRIGTHTGEAQLRSRIRQHFVHENKDRSIFRKHIGRALLNRTGDPFLRLWDVDRTSSAVRRTLEIDLVRLAEVESEVSGHIRTHCSIAVLPVREKTQRLLLESRAISTLSLCPACAASGGWLGSCSPVSRIRESGLWVVNELYKQPLGPEDMEALSHPADRSSRLPRKSSWAG